MENSQEKNDKLDLANMSNKEFQNLVKKCDVAEDGTGYSITVTKHYRSMREKQGEFVKKGQFVYLFALVDLNTRSYIGYAVSIRSEGA